MPAGAAVKPTLPPVPCETALAIVEPVNTARLWFAPTKSVASTSMPVTFACAVVTAPVTESVSVPSPPEITSAAVKLPASTKVSSPSPPVRESTPAAAVIVSFPAPPSMVSLPPAPPNTSAPALPVAVYPVVFCAVAEIRPDVRPDAFSVPTVAAKVPKVRFWSPVTLTVASLLPATVIVLATSMDDMLNVSTPLIVCAPAETFDNVILTASDVPATAAVVGVIVTA